MNPAIALLVFPINGITQFSLILRHQVTETYYENDITVYKGWLIERLYRQEGNGSYAEVLFFDYCLGADGNLYLLISKKDDPTNEPLVLNCICYSPAFLNNPYCNIYSSVIAGVVGSLDAIPLDENDSRRNVHLTLDDDYYYNYPTVTNGRKIKCKRRIWKQIRPERDDFSGKLTNCCSSTVTAEQSADMWSLLKRRETVTASLSEKDRRF